MKKFWIFILGVITAIVGFFIFTDKSPTADTPPINNEQQGGTNTPITPEDPTPTIGLPTVVSINVNDPAGMQGYSFQNANGIEVQELTIGETYTFNLWIAPNYAASFPTVNGVEVPLPYTFVADVEFNFYAQLEVTVPENAVNVTINSPYAIVDIQDTNGELVRVGDVQHKHFISGETYVMNNIAINEGYDYANGWIFEGLYIDGVEYPNWQGATFSVFEGSVIEVRIVSIGSTANVVVENPFSSLTYNILNANGNVVSEYAVGTTYRLEWSTMDTVTKVVVDGWEYPINGENSIEFTPKSNTTIVFA